MSGDLAVTAAACVAARRAACPAGQNNSQFCLITRDDQGGPLSFQALADPPASDRDLDEPLISPLVLPRHLAFADVLRG